MPEFGIVKKLVIHKKIYHQSMQSYSWRIRSGGMSGKKKTEKKNEDHIGLRGAEAACQL